MLGVVGITQDVLAPAPPQVPHNAKGHNNAQQEQQGDTQPKGPALVVALEALLVRVQQPVRAWCIQLNKG